MPRRTHAGFTIVELLIVIVVIGILAAIVTVAYNGIQQRTRSTKAQSDIAQVYRLIEAYNAENGHYPVTAAALFINWNTSTARTDANCAGGSRQADWVPDLDVTLPQSDPVTVGAQDDPACYMYVSDGTQYVLSAFNAAGAPQTTTMYRRVGFREPWQTIQLYLCNHINIGGSPSGAYITADDYYKYSYTISNITNCDETPPVGA